MGMTRRGLFRGMLGLGAATVLAPVAKLLPKPEPKLIILKARSLGITTWDIPWTDTTRYGNMVFKPKVYSVSFRCNIAPPVSHITEGDMDV